MTRFTVGDLLQVGGFNAGAQNNTTDGSVFPNQNLYHNLSVILSFSREKLCIST